MQFFYEVQKSPAKLVDAILGPDKPNVNGTEALLKLGDNTCGSIKTPIPSSSLNRGSKGKEVVFLQQLLEDLGVLDTSSPKVTVGTFDDETADAIIQYKFDELNLSCEACFNAAYINPSVWTAMCKDMEIKTGVVVGGEREWCV